MNDVFKKRAALFLLGCIPVRLLLVAIVKNISLKYLPYLGYVGLVGGLSFIYLFLFGNKTADGQLAWTGEKYIWWNKFRVLHGLFYILFAIFAIRKQQAYAWKILLLDVLVGLSAWINHHFGGKT
jgi:hypothetical protein